MIQTYGTSPPHRRPLIPSSSSSSPAALLSLLLLLTTTVITGSDGRSLSSSDDSLERDLLLNQILRSSQKSPVAFDDKGERSPDTNAVPTTARTTSFQSFSLDHHHSNSEVNEILSSIHDACPSQTLVYELSERSIGGWPLTVIRFGPKDSSNGTKDGEEDKNFFLLMPEVRIVGNIHGNEVLGRELLLKLSHYLCQMLLVPNPDPGTEAADVQKLLNWTLIHLMPSMNPDGWDTATRSLTEGVNGDSGSNSDAMVSGTDGIVGRTNGNGVDLNRDFPDISPSTLSLSSSSSFEHELQPETRAVVEWMRSGDRHFVLSAALHGGSLVANYPYDHTPVVPGFNHSLQSLSNSGFGISRSYAPTPDDDTFRSLALTYARNHESMWKSHGCDAADSDFALNDGITNGAAWYPVVGGMQDFSYLATNAFELTIELGCDKYPPAESLDHQWTANKNSLIEFLWRAHAGIKGLVREEDTTSGGSSDSIGLTAKISLKNVTSGRDQIIDHDVFSEGTKGQYWRLLTPGVYEVTVDAGRDFDPVTKLVSVPKIAGRSPATRIDFFLKRRRQETPSATDAEDQETQSLGNSVNPPLFDSMKVMAARKRSGNVSPTDQLPELNDFLAASRSAFFLPDDDDKTLPLFDPQFKNRIIPAFTQRQEEDRDIGTGGEKRLLMLTHGQEDYGRSSSLPPAFPFYPHTSVTGIRSGFLNGDISSSSGRGAGVEMEDESENEDGVEDMRMMMDSGPSAGLSYDFSNPELLEYGKLLMRHTDRVLGENNGGERLEDGMPHSRRPEETAGNSDDIRSHVTFM